jgi:hypothetical protein
MAKRTKKLQNEYDGYYPDTDEVPVVCLAKYDSEKFYEDFVRPRRPAVIQGSLKDIDLEEFQPDTIIDLLKSDDLLLVERKDKGGYGSGTERLKMTFETFMKTLKAGVDDYYLTTQYNEDDPDEVKKALAHRSEMDDSDDYDEEQGHHVMRTNVVNESDSEHGEEDDGKDQGPIPTDTFSEADSIDFTNLHDDFDELSQTSVNDNDDELITSDIPGEPLYLCEAQARVRECIQKPLTKLVGTLALQPTIMDKLVTQQINLWVGRSNESRDEFKPDPEASDYGLGRRVFGGGVSSGLHHDHADNMYIPTCGSKRFTIFAPMDAERMDTVGSIDHIYSSGVIDYKNNDNAPGWRSLRGDSAILTEVAKWRLDSEDISEQERKELIETIESEEDVLQGFETRVIDSNGIKKDPPSFSRIPAALLHLDKVKSEELRMKLQSFAESRWPEFFKSKRMTAYLEPGQMLYLPAGWFHEVTSFGSDDRDNFHIALNYWFSPPDCKEGVYKDRYWTDDFKRTIASCEHLKSSEHMK